MCSFQGALKEKREKAKAFFCVIGDWSSGMIGVSKTFGGGSIPSSPVRESLKQLLQVLFCFKQLLIVMQNV